MTTKRLLPLSLKHAFRGLADGSSRDKAFPVSKKAFTTALKTHISIRKRPLTLIEDNICNFGKNKDRI